MKLNDPANEYPSLNLPPTLRVVDDVARVDEIARMLGGVRITATTRQHADELLRHAREDAAAG